MDMNIIKDYILLKDYDCGGYEILFYDHELTNGEIEKAKEIVDKVKQEVEDYDNEDIEQALDEILPYITSLTISDMDDYHTVLY